MDVNVSCAYEPDSQYENIEAIGVTVDFTEPPVSELAAGTPENLGDDNNNQTTATVTVSGDPIKSINAVVGTVTITIDSGSY